MIKLYYLHKKYTKDRFREDPEYYNKVLAEQRRKLLEKRDKISGILKKKLAKVIEDEEYDCKSTYDIVKMKKDFPFERLPQP